MGSRQDRDYEYIQVTWGIKIAKFLVEMELFPPNQSDGKEMFGPQLIGPQGNNSEFIILSDFQQYEPVHEISNNVPF